jgi:hypothetical protein
VEADTPLLRFTCSDESQALASPIVRKVYGALTLVPFGFTYDAWYFLDGNLRMYPNDLLAIFIFLFYAHGLSVLSA